MEKMIKCECGYTVRSDTDRELVAKVQEHAKDFHKMDFTAEQVLAMAQPVGN